MYSLRSMETDGLVVRTVYAEERAFQTMQGEIAADWKRGLPFYQCVPLCMLVQLFQSNAFYIM